MAGLTTFATSFGSFLWIVGKVTATVMTAFTSRFRGPSSIIREVTGVFVGRHCGFSSPMK